MLMEQNLAGCLNELLCQLSLIFKIIIYLCTVVGEYMYTMKTTFDFNFVFIKLLNILKNMETKRSCQLKKLFFD